MLEVKIGKMRIILPDELEQRFRKEVGDGNLKQALIQAVEEWIVEHTTSPEQAKA